MSTSLTASFVHDAATHMLINSCINPFGISLMLFHQVL